MSNDQQHPHDPNQAAQGNQQTPPPGVIPPPLAPSNSPKEKQQRFCEKWKHELEFVAVGAAVIYAVFTYFEWVTFDSERKIMEKEFSSSETNSAAQLQALRGQLEEMQLARMLDERAWVFAETHDNTVITEGTNVIFVVMARNVGKTPAIITGDVIRTATDLNKIPKFDDEVIGEEAMVVPNQPLRLTLNINPVLGAMKDNNPLYVYGTVFYKDISGNKHWTQFCYSITDMGAKTFQLYTHSSSDDVGKANGK